MISEKTIEGRADKFIGVLKKLENLFVNMEQMLESIGLILTRSSIESIEDFKEYLHKEFLPNQLNYLSYKQKLLIEYFTSNKGKIWIFRNPKQ